ncbi:MAG: DegV family protein [Tissierellia bacterium]|nr:DegV family protein [Tissierellia bacterium]MDD4781165.1 DegV family protein [Tissierellia bacterium]
MKNYVIVTESTADLPVNIIEEFDIKVIPMSFELEGKGYVNYPDNRELQPHEFYQRLKNGQKSITSLVNTACFIEFFEPIIKNGQEILYIGFSSGLSGTYNASLLAVDELREKYPDVKILCFDSKSASMGEGLFTYIAAKKKEAGLNIDELYEWLKKNVLQLCQWFTVDDLNHLKRGGRVSALTASIGTALNIKPVLHVDDEGHLIPMLNVRGRKKSIHALYDHMEKTCVNPEEQVVFIGHGDCFDEANYLGNLIKDKLKVRDVVINDIGPVIGTHSGPGTIALFYFGNGR